MFGKVFGHIRRHPYVYSSGAGLAATGGGYAFYRRKDPEYSLFLGGKQGKRIIPEKHVRQWMKKEVDPVLPGYSVDRIEGYWKGTREPTRRLSYMGTIADEKKMERLAQAYARRFKQESVLMTRQSAKNKFVS